MPKSFSDRLAALEALEAEPSGPPMVELPPLSDDELGALIDQGLRSRDLFAGNGNPWFFGSDPYWRAVAQRADDWYWCRYEADPQHFTVHVPITADEARLTRDGIQQGRVSVVGGGDATPWLDVRSGVDLDTPLHAAVKAASNAIGCVYGYFRRYDEVARRYVVPVPLDVMQLLDEWSQDEKP